MLNLQRASAGSGKTFTLAGNFIRLLLTVPGNGGRLRLRTTKEISDALPRILAITFTNKATNEMKDRIITKLAALANTSLSNNISNEELSKIDYLEELSLKTGASVEKISETASEALKTVLNNFSDFKVTTIDSFFQEILRTFTYEANINDSFQIELDEDFLASSAIDSALEELNARQKNNPILVFWLKTLMADSSQNSNQWNLFTGKKGKASLYQSIKEHVNRLEKEEYKGIHTEMELWFSDEKNASALISSYLDFKNKAKKQRKEAFDRIIVLRRELIELLDKYDAAEKVLKSAQSHIDKIPNLSFDDKTSDTDPFKTGHVTSKNSIFPKGCAIPGAGEINAKAMEMYEALEAWKDISKTPLWEYWMVYGHLIPFLGLIMEIRKFLSGFMEVNNILRIDDTKTILRKIIGDDDTPFIYERMGSFINHYLIDEFQDTSRMQWEIIKPLLSESESRDQENLIIGDAKQSIYRFRNADPSLITSVVPKEFTNHREAGLSERENTNWRSKRKIVEFNNFFFHHLAREMMSLRQGEDSTQDFTDLYGNVVQFPHKRKDEGYVEIRFFESDSKGSTSYDEEEGNADNEPLLSIGPLISELISRGYEQKDIAILVNTNIQGREVIEALIRYNSINGTSIGFVSEDSLFISSAKSVTIILEVLKRIIDLRFKDNTQEAIDKKRLQDDFFLYSLIHPELNPDEVAEAFNKDLSPSHTIFQMLDSMQTSALPALVEATVEKIIPDELKKKEAIFLAAFQDAVIDYCARYQADPASFLTWWEDKGKKLSVSSPEGTNAVQIMTIHKSKGLEFPCVILPFTIDSLVPSMRNTEWRWVKPSEVLKDFKLPPYLPVETISNLKDTIHKNIYTEYHDSVLLDKINSKYVAFTRAVNELYIFTKKGTKISKNSISYFLSNILDEGNIDYFDAIEKKIRNKMIDQGDLKWNEEKNILSIGHKFSIEEIIGEKRNIADKERASSSVAIKIIENYSVHSKRPFLNVVVNEGLNITEDTSEDEKQDPRAEGTILHEAMALISTSKDIRNAVLKLKSAGLIDWKKSKEIEKFLREEITLPIVADWFSGRWKILKERSIIIPGKEIRRPDRIMISEDDTQAVILDYKFGNNPEHKIYIYQVREYMKAFSEATGIKNIKGYLWFVKLRKLKDVVTGQIHDL